jgi:hypothetical protein
MNTTNAASKSQLPEHLHAAYDWIDSAGEWTEALSDPSYAAGAYANAVEQNQSDVTQSDIEDAIEWFRKQKAAGSYADTSDEAQIKAYINDNFTGLDRDEKKTVLNAALALGDDWRGEIDEIVARLVRQVES